MAQLLLFHSLKIRISDRGIQDLRSRHIRTCTVFALLACHVTVGEERGGREEWSGEGSGGEEKGGERSGEGRREEERGGER